MSTTHPSRPQVTAEIPAVPLTTEGYSVLHQMMRFRWPAWRALPAAEKSDIAKEAADVLSAMEKNSAGQSALFSLIGHKGDLMLIHFRNSFADLNQAELQLANLRLSDYLEPTTSYLSIIELGLYESTLKIYKELTDQGIEPHSDQWKAEIECKLNRHKEAMKPRLYPEIPTNRYACFYPDGPPPRRRQELVQASHRRARPPDERSRPSRPPLRRRSQTDHQRLDWLRRLGMGRRSLRRRSTGLQEADLRNALRRSQRRLRPVRPVLCGGARAGGETGKTPEPENCRNKCAT